MEIKLKNSYPSIHKLPVIHGVDTDIFEITYFMKCMECNFCKDQCCEWGADIDMQNVSRLMKYKDELEQFTGIKSDKWFDESEKGTDYEYPGNEYMRTMFDEEKDACIFLNTKSRGCMIHSFALSKGIDYHEIKPTFCSLFPVTYMDGVLMTPEEIDEGLTACLGEGPTLYQGSRDELLYYFGEGLVAELDALQNEAFEKKKVIAAGSGIVGTGS
jgi:Fe-S-cluster containining protein